MATAQHSALASGQLISRRPIYYSKPISLPSGGAVMWQPKRPLTTTPKTVNQPFLLGVGRRDLDPRLTTVLTTFVLCKEY